MSTAPPKQKASVLFIIAAFKLLKGILLLGAAAGLFGLLHHDVQQVAENWVNHLRVDPHNKYVAHFLAKLGVLDDRDLESLGGLTVIYALVFITEGVGLFLRKRWAEYLTAIVTASFIPLEIYEIIKESNTPKTVLVTGNVLIVVYLVIRLRRERDSGAKRRSQPAAIPVAAVR